MAYYKIPEEAENYITVFETPIQNEDIFEEYKQQLIQRFEGANTLHDPSKLALDILSHYDKPSWPDIERTLGEVPVNVILPPPTDEQDPDKEPPPPPPKHEQNPEQQLYEYFANYYREAIEKDFAKDAFNMGAIFGLQANQAQKLRNTLQTTFAHQRLMGKDPDHISRYAVELGLSNFFQASAEIPEESHDDLRAIILQKHNNRFAAPAPDTP